MARKKNSNSEDKEKNSLDKFREKYKAYQVPGEKLAKEESQILRTGSPKLDLMLRGGFRAGTISELYGPESSGKSTIALAVTRGVLDRGGRVLYLDLEKGLDGGVNYPDGHIRGWLEINGIDPNNPNFQIMRAGSGEMVYELIEEAIKSELFELIVLDSMASLIPLADLEGNVGESSFGRVAKLNSEALKRVLHAYDVQSVEKTHFMIINQARDSVGTTVKGLHSTGGRALRHYVSTKLKCVRIGKDADSGVNILNVRTDKNRFSPPWEEVNLYVHPLCGIDIAMDLLEEGVAKGYIEKSGAWYTIVDTDTGEEMAKLQGKDAVRQWFDANPDIKQRMLDKIWEVGRKALLT